MKSVITKTVVVQGQSITVKATWIYDANYGADADGKRGIPCWFLDDVEYEGDEALNDEICAIVETWDFECNENIDTHPIED